MQDLTKKAFSALARFLITFALILFLAAWTLAYWQAWLFLAVFSVAVIAITYDLARNDPQLLERRLNAGPGAEKSPKQKIIQLLAMVAFIAILIFPPIDHRHGWSTVPPLVSVFGDLLVALGFLIIFFVFRANTYASAVIETSADQRIITTGPYAFVRHPMYSGALVMLLGVPLALGSWWGLLTIIPLALVLVWRLLDEEKFLLAHLAGYAEYQTQVPHRLLPCIW
jgi:protein-S-isoprenylcysteine O-methyltransferase Ste14